MFTYALPLRIALKAASRSPATIPWSAMANICNQPGPGDRPRRWTSRLGAPAQRNQRPFIDTWLAKLDIGCRRNTGGKRRTFRSPFHGGPEPGASCWLQGWRITGDAKRISVAKLRQSCVVRLSADLCDSHDSPKGSRIAEGHARTSPGVTWRVVRQKRDECPRPRASCMH